MSGAEEGGITLLQEMHVKLIVAMAEAQKLSPEAVEAKAAWYEVSCLKEIIASMLSPKCEAGFVARHGAVEAARCAGDEPRARELLRRYATEDGFADKGWWEGQFGPIPKWPASR
ncbi:hypothetical protein FJY93_02730 [Candidatus Kaiserbacteria bacterium]|nr:hypothetical protein [Candidatus Kaiserbacteria bacterium]